MVAKKHVQFLNEIGAPLRNNIKSWGSVRESDGAIFLVLWLDRVQRIDDSQYVQMTANGKFASDSRFGAKERLQHIEMIRSVLSATLSWRLLKIPRLIRGKLKNYAAKMKCFFPATSSIIMASGGFSWADLFRRKRSASLIKTSICEYDRGTRGRPQQWCPKGATYVSPGQARAATPRSIALGDVRHRFVRTLQRSKIDCVRRMRR